MLRRLHHCKESEFLQMNVLQNYLSRNRVLQNTVDSSPKFQTLILSLKSNYIQVKSPVCIAVQWLCHTLFTTCAMQHLTFYYCATLYHRLMWSQVKQTTQPNRKDFPFALKKENVRSQSYTMNSASILNDQLLILAKWGKKNTVKFSQNTSTIHKIKVTKCQFYSWW